MSKYAKHNHMDDINGLLYNGLQWHVTIQNIKVLQDLEIFTETKSDKIF
jgi:hypothetical protein